MGDIPPASDLKVTESVGNLGEFQRKAFGHSASGPTQPDVIGPYYRAGAPYRAKLSSPLAEGGPLLISGRVWHIETRRPISGCLLDLWQADSTGHYDDEDPAHPPPPHSFINRARTVTDERGVYEFETVYPGPYRMDPTTWRSPHIHFLVRAVGARTLITQLFFAGAPYLDTDPFVKKSLIISLIECKAPGGVFRSGHFDIILASDIDPELGNTP